MAEQNGDKIKIHERIARLEANVETILENHLPHIQKSVDKLGSKFWAIIILLVSNLAGLVIALTLIVYKLK